MPIATAMVCSDEKSDAQSPHLFGAGFTIIQSDRAGEGAALG